MCFFNTIAIWLLGYSEKKVLPVGYLNFIHNIKLKFVKIKKKNVLNIVNTITVYVIRFSKISLQKF